MPRVEDVLGILRNGRWHELKEIEERTQLDSPKVKSVTRFLAKYDFVKLDDKGQKIQLAPSTWHFLKKIRQIESGDKP